MSSQSLQAKYLDRILNSKEFSSSKIYRNFLTYLVEATDQGKGLKEMTIALEFFGKDASFNPAEDTIVRSHTYNLRKKLESYYYNEGREDKYRLEIPKGHYEVAFHSVNNGPMDAKTRLTTFFRRRYPLLLFIAALALVGFQWLQNQSIEKQLREYRTIDPIDPIWSDYLRSDLPILIAVGNHFFFDEYSAKYEQAVGIRHGKINSLEDFEAFKASHSGNNLSPTEEPYFPYHSIWSLPPILSLFYSVHKEPIMRKSSALSPQILDEYNIIFLGSIKTLYILKHTLSRSHFDFEISPHKVVYTPSDTSSNRLFETSLHSPGPNDDLVLAVKLPGPVQNSIFIIASFHSLGAPEIAKFLTNATTRNQLEDRFVQQLGYVPKYFEMLFRVTGIDKTAYNTEILICEEITVP